MRKALYSLSAVISASALINLCNAVLLTVLPVYLAAASSSQDASALLAAAYSLGFLLGCVWGPRAISRTGHIRAFAAAASVCTIVTVMFTWH
ncbi:MAG: MFS transporter, partial [Hyphomicrobiales bacterium]